MSQSTPVLSDRDYHLLRGQTTELRNAWHESLEHGQKVQLETFKATPSHKMVVPQGDPSTPGWTERHAKLLQESAARDDLAKSFIQEMIWKRHPSTKSDGTLTKAGVNTSLGFNFYDLRGPAYLIYPVNVYFRNTIPRISKVNEGWGTQAHWKASRSPGQVYTGVAEGNRGQIGTPNETDYFATYKEQGAEGQVTYTAEFAGEGYTDNLADEHLRDLHRLFLGEEGMFIGGNSGTANPGTSSTGFSLAAVSSITPTGAVAATRSASASGGAAGNQSSGPGNSDLPYTAALTTANYVSVAVVALTAMGNPNNNQYGYGVFPTVAGGITVQYTRTNADGTTDVINCGVSPISIISAPVQATSSNLSIKFQIPAASLPLKGVFGYAWFADVETSNVGTLGNALLAGITSTPWCYINGTPTGTQTGSSIANYRDISSGVANADHCFSALDMDGFMSYAASTAGSYYTDLQGASLTPVKNGRVVEIENVLQYIWNNYQTTVDEIWGDAYAIECLDSAVRWTGSSNGSGLQFWYTRDAQNNVLGGFVVSSYQSRFAFNNPTGAKAIPIRIHPMIPAGTLYFHIKNNPYPQSRLPWVWAAMVQREYYSIEWPQTSRKWPFGTYVHEVLASTVPWIPGLISGIGPFVGN